MRTFNVVTIGKAIQRTPTQVDPDGKLFVLAKDKAQVANDPGARIRWRSAPTRETASPSR